MSYLCNVQVRNKPIEPPKKPENAPFFLPTLPTISGEISFKLGDSENEEVKQVEAENHGRKSDILSSQLLHFLQSCSETKKCKPIFLLIFIWIIWNHESSERFPGLCISYFYMLQFRHSLIISKACLHQLWIWSFECYRSLTMMISKNLKKDQSYIQSRCSWIILYTRFHAGTILSLYRPSSGCF